MESDSMLESQLAQEVAASAEVRVEEAAEAVATRRKDAVLNIRVNSDDLRRIKEKAGRMGVKYQTFISEILHRVSKS